jgi:GT2 family glycosyltransferase
MKVYTIIVTFNGMKWIEKCLLSIILQTKVVVVDNNSSDSTVNFIKTKFPDVLILPQNVNLGFGIANNLGISYALRNHAEAIFLLNQDSYADSNCINELVSVYEKNQEYGIISPIHLNGSGSDIEPSFLNFINSRFTGDLLIDIINGKQFKSIYDLSFVNAAAWFIPSKVFKKVGGFDPIFFLYGEDDNYCQRVIFHNFKIGITLNAKIFHDSNNNNLKYNEIGSDSYYRHYMNELYVRFLNVNSEDYKKIKLYKNYIFRKSMKKFFFLKFSEFKIYYKKYKMINCAKIRESVESNRIIGDKYL